jgi:formate hydrogenlyase transcriptional activator
MASGLYALPVTVRGRRIGAITVGSLAKNQYTDADADFLMEVANQIAIAVDNMRAHEETEALKARFQAEAVYLQEEIKTEHNFEEIIGQSTQCGSCCATSRQSHPPRRPC